MKSVNLASEHNGRIIECVADIYSDNNKKTLVILKCTKNECSEDFGNYIRKLASEAIKVIPEKELEDVIWGQYYPENMRRYLRNENLSVVIFNNDDELYLRTSRSIVKNELIKYSGYMIEDF